MEASCLTQVPQCESLVVNKGTGLGERRMGTGGAHFKWVFIRSLVLPAVIILVHL